MYSTSMFLTCDRRIVRHHEADGVLLVLLQLAICCDRGVELRHCGTGHLQTVRLALLGGWLALSWRYGPLPSPFDQRHAVADGLGNYLSIAVQEETRFHLQDKM